MEEYTTMRITTKNKSKLDNITKILKEDLGWVNQITLNDAVSYLITLMKKK